MKYVVIAEKGEYPGRETWAVASFDSREEADALVERIKGASDGVVIAGNFPDECCTYIWMGANGKPQERRWIAEFRVEEVDNEKTIAFVEDWLRRMKPPVSEEEET